MIIFLTNIVKLESNIFCSKFLHFFFVVCDQWFIGLKFD